MECEGLGGENWGCLRGEGEEITVVLVMQKVATRDYLSAILSNVWPAWTRVARVLVQLPSEEWSSKVQSGMEHVWNRPGIPTEVVTRGRSLVRYEVLEGEEI